MDISENKLLEFLKERSKKDGFNYMMFAIAAADLGFLGFYDCQKILNHIITDYSIMVKDNREQFNDDLLHEVYSFFKNIQICLEAGNK